MMQGVEHASPGYIRPLSLGTFCVLAQYPLDFHPELAHQVDGYGANGLRADFVQVKLSKAVLYQGFGRLIRIALALAAPVEYPADFVDALGFAWHLLE